MDIIDLENKDYNYIVDEYWRSRILIVKINGKYFSVVLVSLNLETIFFKTKIIYRETKNIKIIIYWLK